MNMPSPKSTRLTDTSVPLFFISWGLVGSVVAFTPLALTDIAKRSLLVAFLKFKSEIVTVNLTPPAGTETLWWPWRS